MEALRGLLGHGRADGGMVRVVAVEEGMAVRVHLRDGHATPHGRLLHVRDGRGERGADNLGAARRALICGDGRGGSERGELSDDGGFALSTVA